MDLDPLRTQSSVIKVNHNLTIPVLVSMPAGRINVEDNVSGGCNIENSIYGLAICAERVAVFTAVSSGSRGILYHAPAEMLPFPLLLCHVARVAGNC